MFVSNLKGFRAFLFRKQKQWQILVNMEDWLIWLFTASSPFFRMYHTSCQWRVVKFGLCSALMAFEQGGLSLSTHAVIRSLSFYALIWRTAPFNHLLRIVDLFYPGEYGVRGRTNLWLLGHNACYVNGWMRSTPPRPPSPQIFLVTSSP
jgi:hypothetical protein